MASINLGFESFEELVAFARDISGTYGQPAAVEEKRTQPAVQEGVTMPYGQQIAQNFPAANTGVGTQAVPVSAQTPTQPAAVRESQASAVPTSQHTYTADELTQAAMQLMDKGLMSQLQELLVSFGVESLPSLPQEQYGNFATALRGLGAQI